MNVTTHPVAPEEVMALLDGELSAAEAAAVSAHLDHCADCARLAEQLRSTSQMLSAWSVPAIPATVENSIADIAQRAGSGRKIGWKPWVVAGGAAVATLLFVAIVSRNRPAPPREMYAAYDRLEQRAAHSFAIDGQPASDQQRKIASPVPAAPMIARTVSLAIVVKEFATARSNLDALLERHHGYAAQLNVGTPENAPRVLQASLRIPAPELASAVRELRKLGRVENETQGGEEVTQQHADLVARLKNARNTEERLRAILQQRTGKIGDILQVEQEIARIRGDIERMQAEQNALEHRVDFATIDLQLTEEFKAELNAPTTSVGTRMRNAFVAGYHNASETVIGLALLVVQYGPTLLIWLVVPIIFLRRRYRRIRAGV